MTYDFCPKCGTRYFQQEDSEKLVCQNCSFAFYQNSKPATAAIITNNQGQLLLSKRSIDPNKGKWDLVGGFLNLGENPEHGMLREIKEETGMSAEIQNLLGIFTGTYVYDGVAYAILVICYKVIITDGLPQASDDSEELRWFSATELPADIANPVDRQMINAWIASS